jgi:hypothetical protein
MNLNELAKDITLQEGKAQSLSIAQVKEVMKLVFTRLADLSSSEVEKILKKYRASRY